MTEENKNLPSPDDTTKEVVSPAPSSGSTIDPLVGTKIGSCTLKRRIGSGGMGTVYEAIQESPQRRVALKMMKRGIASQSSLRRFEFESQALAKLKHQGVAHVYEAGTHDDGSGGVPYFVMEYVVNAKHITEYADEKKLGTKERLALFAKVCDAVQHGHLKGIVHRDLKPGNILVDSSGQPKIIDFGVARSTDSDMAITTLQTDVGQLVGTLQYMSPEQVEADPSDIDVRSDVYALGVILYELLTGKPPYDIKQVAIHEAVRIVRETEPTKLSTIDRHLRGDIETIAMKALEKERDRRYQSATALQEDVEHYLNDEPIAARPPGAIDYLRRFAKKHRAAALAITSVFVVLVVAVVGISTYAVRAKQEKVRAETAMTEALELAEASSRYIGSMINFENMQLLYNTLGEEKIDDILAFATDQAKKEFSKDTHQQRMLFSVLDRIAVNYGLMSMDEKAAGLMQEPIELSRVVLGELDPDTLRMISNRGYHLTGHDNDQAAALLNEALTGQRSILGDIHRDTLLTNSYMGFLLSAQDEFEKAEKVLIDTLSKQREFLGEEDPNTLHTLHVMGVLLWKQDKLDDAEKYFLDALNGRERILGERDPRTQFTTLLLANLLAEHGSQLVSKGNVKLSLEKFGKALKFFSNLVDSSKNDPSNSNRLARLASRFAGNEFFPLVSDKALEAASRAYELSVMDAKFPETLARVHYNREEYDEAEKYFREELEIRQRIHGNEDPATQSALNNLSYTLFIIGTQFQSQGKFDMAERYLLESLEGLRGTHGAEHPNTLSTINALVELYNNWGKLEEAQKYRAMLPEEDTTTEDAGE